MEMINVQSSNLKRVGYDEQRKILKIEFHNGTYVYFNVPKQVFESLLKAPSKGEYHADFIKNVYQYQKIN